MSTPSSPSHPITAHHKQQLTPLSLQATPTKPPPRSAARSATRRSKPTTKRRASTSASRSAPSLTRLYVPLPRILISLTKILTDPQVSTIDKDLSRAKHETESYAKSAKAETLKKIDEMDRKVEEQAAKSKGYLSSWFGSK